MTVLLNAVFRGLACNTRVKDLSVDIDTSLLSETEHVPVSIPCLPPNLSKLSVRSFDFRENVSLPELILRHQHLKKLHLEKCQFCPISLGLAIDDKNLTRLSFWDSDNTLKEFFDSINSSILQELTLAHYSNNEFQLDIEALHRAIKDKRLLLHKLKLLDCLSENQGRALATMLADDTPIKKLELAENYFEEDVLHEVITSLQHNGGLQDLYLDSSGSNSSRNVKALKDYVRSRPDGTLKRVCLALSWPNSIQQEINVLLAINKVKPFVSEDVNVPDSVVLSILQHERLDCINFFLREKLEVILSCVDTELEEPIEPPPKRQKTGSL